MSSLGNASRGTHAASLDASRTVYQARVKLAQLSGYRRPDHVVFTCNATEALNIAICGTIDPGRHVITTDLEHNSVLRPLYRLQAEKQVKLSFVAVDRRGNIDNTDFEELIRPDTQAIVCTHASNLTGNMVDVARVGQIAKKHGLIFIVDASQTAGCAPIDMEAMKIDILCFTGHKALMGPQGTGGLCIREGVKIRPWKVGGTGVQTYSKAQPEQLPALLEAGTLNGHGIAGLAAAVDYINSVGLDAIQAKERFLTRRFYDGVSQIEGVTVYGDFTAEQRAPIVALNIRGFESGEAADELAETYGIATRPGAHCAPRMHQALGTTEQGAVRFSFGWFNEAEEVDAAIRAVKELASCG
jgi:cysteine desulfurase family protein